MAALLRSARLLKSSPCPLLHVIGSSRWGPAGARPYGGGVRGAPRDPHTPLGGFHTNSLHPYRSALPCASWRQYGVVSEQRGTVKDDASLAVRSKQAQQFDWALAKLDSSVRRTGRVTKTLLMRIFHDVCRTGYPSGNQALLLLRSCGSLLPEVPLVERTELAQRIWEKLYELGATYDVSHYNALLKTYLQNEFKFSPTEFLAKMEEANVQPNRVTYQRLIAAYCQHGDIDGASTILGFMKSKDLPITEAVFNSLVIGHAKAGDMDSSEGILTVMKGAGIEPGPDTYLSLLNVYAEKGDISKIKETLEKVESADIHLMDRDLMQVVFSLTKAGHHEYVPGIVERMRHERGYVPDAMNLCLSLITQGYEETAFSVLKSFTGLHMESQNNDSPDLGNFFLRHCVNMDKSVEKMAGFCKDLKDSGLHSTPLQFTLQCALEAKKTGISVELMRKMKEGGLPVRPHYFWPLLTHHQKDKNITAILEILRGMQELEVPIDVETFTTYILPSFGSVDIARTTLKEAGFDVNADSFIAAELRKEASQGNFEGLLCLMSSPTLPAIDLSAFRASLLLGFRGFTDVERMAKITEILYKDSRFNRVDPESSENVPYFLYNLIDAMSETDVQSKEEKLREYFGLLKNMNITISLNIFRGIRNILESYHVPELIKDVLALVDKKENGTDAPLLRGAEGRVSFMEKTLADLKAEGKPADSILKKIIGILCLEEKLDQALELKAQYEQDMTPAAYAMLINLCCRHDNAEEALNLKRELARKDSEVSLDAQKYAALVRVLAKHGKLEEAVDILKEMKEKDVQLRDGTINLLTLTMNTAALKGDANTVRRLQETIFSLGLAKPSSNLCAPLITCYLESGDYAGAFSAVEECNKQYNQMPKIHDLICSLVEKGDAEMLQKVMEFLSQERGEMMMLYDLYFAFLQTGRYKEARKIIETPGLRARPTRLQWFAEKCISAQQMEPLENMVDMTVKLFECDRDDMYHYLFRLCKETNDWRKAEAAWTKMQEENLIPRERTLRLLADILKSNNQEVPFEVPELWFEEVKGQPETLLEREVKSDSMVRKKATNSSPKEATPDDYRLKLLSLCKKGKVQEAYNVLKEADGRGIVLGPAPYGTIIKALLASGNIEDAFSVKDIATNRIPGFKLSDMANNLLIVTHVKRSQIKDAFQTFKGMLQADQVPSQLAITRLAQGLGSEGNTQGLQELEALVNTLGSVKLSNMLFVNNTALSHIKNGDIDSAVELLESVYTQKAEHSQNPSISFVFRKVLDANNEAALDKLSAMAERLCNHFASYRAATDLFLMYLDTGKTEEAKFLLQRCAAIAEQKDVMFTYMLRAAQHTGQAAKIKTLTELIPDFTEKENVYSYLVKSYGLDKDLKSAKALYEQMQAEGIKADELTLKRLALLYREAGEPVPFQEPSESFRFYADKLKKERFGSETSADD